MLDGYIRISQVGGRSGDRFQSPGQQRDSIEGWAKANGVTIGRWHEDLDRSGGTMDRPGMNAALARIEAGRTSGLVVARLDRFARTVTGGLLTIQRLHEQGARVVSVAEQIDPATPMGRAMLGLLLIMGEWQRDQADEHLAAAQQRAASAGRFPGKPAYGYCRTPEGQTAVDKEAAVVVRRIFRARADGAGWRQISRDLMADGVLSPLGRSQWAVGTLTGLVATEAYLGTFRGPRGLRVEAAWPAIVDRDTWQRANARHGVRDDSRRYQDRLLAGIARCASCRYVLARTRNPAGFVSYACRTVGCNDRPSIGAGLLDEHVSGLVDERLGRLRLEPAEAGGEEGEQLRVARDVAVRELEAWRDDVGLRGVLGEHDWREGLLARARARDGAEVMLAEHDAVSRVRGLAVPVGVRLGELAWEVRRELAEAALHSVFVRRSEARGPAARLHVASRVLVVWADAPGRPVLPSRQGPEPGPLRW